MILSLGVTIITIYLAVIFYGYLYDMVCGNCSCGYYASDGICVVPQWLKLLNLIFFVVCPSLSITMGWLFNIKNQRTPWILFSLISIIASLLLVSRMFIASSIWPDILAAFVICFTSFITAGILNLKTNQLITMTRTTSQ